MNQYFDMDQGKNIMYANDCSSTSGYSSTNSPTISPAHSPATLVMKEFENLNLPSVSNSPSPQHQQLQQPPQQIYQQLQTNGNFYDGNVGNLLSGNAATFENNMYMPRDHFYATPVTIPGGFNQADGSGGLKNEFPAILHIEEQPVEKFRFRYKSEMHGTHGSLNGINSKRTPKTFPEVMLRNYKGPAVIRCSLFQTNLDSPHSHQLVVRKDDRDVCDPHDLHVAQDRGYVAQFINMGIIHTAKKFIFDELFKKKQDRLVFQMGRRELSTKQIQELHQETEREAKEMNLNQVRLCFEAFKVNDDQSWTAIAAPVYSNPINNRKSAQTGELRITRLSKPTGSVMGNDELILLVEKVSKKNIKVRFFEENEDGETVWEAFAKFRESDVHHQYAIVCQTPAYKDKDVEREVGVSIELIRPSDDERSYPSLPFRYKPREAIVSRKRRRTCSTFTTSSSSSGGSANNSMELPNTVPQQGTPMNQTISQEFGRDLHWESIPINQESFDKLLEVNSSELVQICGPLGSLQHDGHGGADSTPNLTAQRGQSLTSVYLQKMFKIFDGTRRAGTNGEHFELSRKQIEQLFKAHASNNEGQDTLLHEVISQRSDNPALVKKTFEMMSFFKLQDLTNIAINAEGDTALHVACQQNRYHYIRSLVSLGCSPNQQNHLGNTALHLAVKDEHISCIESFLNVPGIKLDLTLKNDEGLTPLHMAIRQNKYDVAKKLINHDRSSINVSNTKDGNNALHMAVLEQNTDLIVLILDAQNLTDILLARNAANYTPLELARAKANESIVRLLEEVHPDKGETAMTWIPVHVKEEMDSSSADEDEEVNLDGSMALAIKTENELILECKSEIELDSPPTQQNSSPMDANSQLDKLLNDKIKFDKLVALLNQPSDQNSQLPKWKELAKKSAINQLVFLWSNSEGMLNYIHHKSSGDEYKSFAQALQDLGILNSNL